MDVEISTSDPDHVDPARVAAALQAANLFVLTVTVNEDIDGAWVYDPAADVDMDDRPAGYQDCGCDPAVGHTPPCLLTPEPSLTKVRFEPQAWVNDNAIEVDAQGETDWFVSVETTADIVAATERGTDLDFVKSDPYAPVWVREFQGPFEIGVVDADDIAPAKDH